TGVQTCALPIFDIPPPTNSSIFSSRCSRISSERSPKRRRRKNNRSNQLINQSLWVRTQASFVPQGDDWVHFGRPPRGDVTSQECRKPNHENGRQKDRAALIEWQEIIVHHSELQPR